jgi:hypothetical protein
MHFKPKNKINFSYFSWVVFAYLVTDKSLKSGINS